MSPHFTIYSPANGEAVGQAPETSPCEARQAVEQSFTAYQDYRNTPAYLKADLLDRMSSELARRADEFAKVICTEAGKPIRDARAEVQRAVTTLRIASQEALTISGDVIPLDLTPTGERKTGVVSRFPVGPVLAISPFNFPLNLGLHKVAPALACGCTVVWKPSLQTPTVAYRFLELALECGLPMGALQVITPNNAITESLVSHPLIKMVSFTGSADVGWRLRGMARGKEVTLELGGNAAAIVMPTADLEAAIPKCLVSAFSFSGQVCISLQRLYVHRSLFEKVLNEMVRGASALVSGDPAEERVDFGPLISRQAGDRVEAWIQSALQRGAALHCGGQRSGNFISPAVLTHVPDDEPLSCEELFGPAVILESVDSLDEAVAKTNQSKYGLQASLFSNDASEIEYAHRELEVGAVIVNEGPTFRIDSMPYGGTKESGLGREGVRFAIKSMTTPRLLVQ